MRVQFESTVRLCDLPRAGAVAERICPTIEAVLFYEFAILAPEVLALLYIGTVFDRTYNPLLHAYETMARIKRSVCTDGSGSTAGTATERGNRLRWICRRRR